MVLYLNKTTGIYFRLIKRGSQLQSKTEESEAFGPTTRWFVRKEQTKASHLVEIHVVVKLHCTGLDPEHLQPPLLVGDADVQLAVETTEPSKCRLDDVGAVGRCDNDHVRGGLDAVHQSQQLRHDALLDLASRLVPTRCD